MSVPFVIRRLGEPEVDSPIRLSSNRGDFRANYTGDDEHILHQIEFEQNAATILGDTAGALEKAGPRRKLFFEPSRVHAAIVTCGGLCPGLNDVIRAIVMTLYNQYGVRRITGIRHGYRGLLENTKYPPIELGPDVVQHIHREGGTLLGTARGGGRLTSEIVDTLQKLGIDMLFTIGGDGTQRGALLIAEEIARRDAKIAVVGVPKTIDNDLSFVERSFGFETAVAEAVRAVDGAHTEARDAVDGIGLVKVMGREAGFIAAHAALASNDVDFVLIPEVPFDLVGENGLLSHVERRLDERAHVMLLVAEGAGQHFVASAGVDAGGNKKLGDIGLFLRDRIASHFAEKGREVSMKYIDPSYTIRSQPAIASDSIYCARLGSNAVHAAMSGRTACLVGMVNNHLVHVPIAAAAGQKSCVDPDGPLWRDVMADTGQPPLMTNE